MKWQQWQQNAAIKKKSRKTIMKSQNDSLLRSLTAATVLALVTFTAGAAAPTTTAAPLHPTAASSVQPEVFTIRYVCFVAQLKVTGMLTPAKALAREAKLPPIFEEMQHGSSHSMGMTPGSFLSDLGAVQSDHKFHLLLCGSAICINDDPEVAVLHAGPYQGDSLQTSLTDHITLSRNSPVMATIHQTGKFTYTTAAGINSEGWTDMHADNIVIGRTYSQGINNEMDGSRLVYAFCILPGNLDQTASAWSKAVKAIASHKAATHGKTAAR